MAESVWSSAHLAGVSSYQYSSNALLMGRLPDGGRATPTDGMADPERPEPFRFTDPRQQRVHRRLLLLGPGPAAFFKDACRLMGTGFPLETTPHLVAHLLREVESALRDVLLPYGSERPAPCPRCGSRPGSHKKEIKAILAAYGFKEAEDAAEAWLRLSSWDEDATSASAWWWRSTSQRRARGRCPGRSSRSRAASS